MKISKVISLVLTCIISASLLTACGGKTGSVKNGVYSCSMFKVTTPTENNFRCITDEDKIENMLSYSTLFVNSANRNAHKSFKCEYAAKGKQCDMLVCTEDNVNNYASAEEFANAIQKGTENAIISDMSVLKNEDTTIDGVTFRHLLCRNNDSSTFWDYYIKQSGKKFIYIYISYYKDDTTDYSEPTAGAITAP